MKIVFFEAKPEEKEVFLGAFPGVEFVFVEGELNEDNASLAKDADIISVFVGCIVNKNVLDAMPNLKFILARSTGYDHIDVLYAKSKNIQIANVPGYGAHTVAEFAFGLLLSLSRKIRQADIYVRNSQNFNYLPEFEGFDLAGKTLGVIGTGRIGKVAVQIAKGFRMNVVACDNYPDAVFAKENGFTYKSLDEVISEADIITLHVPYTKENHHLINKARINRMKKGVYIINTARGGLVDTEALLVALKDKRIGAAGLDMLENENRLSDFQKMDNVIITPHMAFFTHEAVDEIQKVTIENLKGFISGSPVNVI